MNRTFLITAILLMLSACREGNCPDPGPDPVVGPSAERFYAKGADLSWITEMEKKGYTFKNSAGIGMECTAIFKELGFNAVRYRVWVNPADGWCGSGDVLAKAKRAQNLGMKVMIDFHYGDSWCDPAKQPTPAAWKGHSADQLARDVSDHTVEVLSLLKENGVDVAWVQVGNEVTNGMLWETCRVQGSNAADFIKVFNAGAAAARKVYPDAQIILHIDNGWKSDTVQWFFDLMDNADFDMMGLSLYPSYWNGSSRSYPDWKPLTTQMVNNLDTYHRRYGKPIMLCEFGMPASQPDKAKEALRYLLDNTKDLEWFKGIFLWEPESEKSRNNYDYGAFSNGAPTIALDPFKD